MDRDKQRGIASKGGKAAHQKGTAHEWTVEEARAAGRKGGTASARCTQQPQQCDRGPIEGEPLYVPGRIDPGVSITRRDSSN